MKLIYFALFLVVFGCTSKSPKSDLSKPDGPVKIIFDTDMGPDYDDVGAIAMLYALANKGECEILATISCDRYPTIAPTIELFNTYFKNATVPIGVPSESAPDQYVKNHWNDSVLSRFGSKGTKDITYPSAVDVYRRILANEGDQSVTIVTIGFMSNISDLLKSQPDHYSPLSGYDLVKKKVKNWVTMAGKFPEGLESNVEKDWKSAQYAFENWPTPILFSGVEIGNRILTGNKLAYNGSEDNPLSWAYRYNLKTYRNKVDENKQSWDQTAVLCAVRKPEKYFYVNGPGKFVTLENGNNEWDPDTNANHYFLTHKYPYQHIADVIDELMMFEPE